MEKWYYRWNNGSLTRISNLPKKKDGFEYFELKLTDGIPTAMKLMKEGDFEGGVLQRGVMREDQIAEQAEKDSPGKRTVDDETGKSLVPDGGTAPIDGGGEKKKNARKDLSGTGEAGPVVKA